MTTSLVLRFAARDWRSGELRLLLAALLLAVGAVSAISLFVDRLQRALVAESTSFLAADRVIDSSQPIPEPFRAHPPPWQGKPRYKATVYRRGGQQILSSP